MAWKFVFTLSYLSTYLPFPTHRQTCLLPSPQSRSRSGPEQVRKVAPSPEAVPRFRNPGVHFPDGSESQVVRNECIVFSPSSYDQTPPPRTLGGGTIYRRILQGIVIDLSDLPIHLLHSFMSLHHTLDIIPRRVTLPPYTFISYPYRPAAMTLGR